MMVVTFQGPSSLVNRPLKVGPATLIFFFRRGEIQQVEIIPFMNLLKRGEDPTLAVEGNIEYQRFLFYFS